MRNVWILLLLLCNACNNPQSRFDRLQHDFWEKLVRNDYFHLKAGTLETRLPLPPDPATRPSAAEIQQLQTEANTIPAAKLSAADQQQLAQIIKALEALSAGKALFDPGQMGVQEFLLQCNNQKEQLQALGQIPAYYAAVEQRWTAPDLRFIQKAVDNAQHTLDLLQQWENNGEKAAAILAIKDFIALCQSTNLK